MLVHHISKLIHLETPQYHVQPLMETAFWTQTDANKLLRRHPYWQKQEQVDKIHPILAGHTTHSCCLQNDSIHAVFVNGHVYLLTFIIIDLWG
jgi:hypothetical protein